MGDNILDSFDIKTGSCSNDHIHLDDSNFDKCLIQCKQNEKCKVAQYDINNNCLHFDNCQNMEQHDSAKLYFKK